MHNKGVVGGEMALIQRWGADEEPQDMPKNKSELLMKGALYLH